MGKLSVVGIGPGNYENMTFAADLALQQCQVIVGYHVYVDLVRERYPDKEFLTTPMTRETERCRMALEEARRGKDVAMICSGDSGIYGMAALLYELRGESGEPEIRVIPGLTSACSGAALLGAPLTHDFAVISLSDRLTHWEKICRRLRRRTCPSPSITPPAGAGRTICAGPATCCWRSCRRTGAVPWPGTSAGRGRSGAITRWDSFATRRWTCSAPFSSETK